MMVTWEAKLCKWARQDITSQSMLSTRESPLDKSKT